MRQFVRATEKMLAARQQLRREANGGGEVEAQQEKGS